MLLRNPAAKALYIFPLKALEQDQLKNLSFLLKGLKGRKISAGIYDGDTSAYQRKQIRANIPQILVTNPDMLHSAILAYHETWEKLFENLSMVVLDEVHTYRGIFGSHTNQSEAQRVCALYVKADLSCFRLPSAIRIISVGRSSKSPSTW
jgi:DEAD/DEAH box helicase domain-containing protein